MGKPNSVFDQLKQARIAKGLTQAEIADLLTCSQSAVSKLESGHLDALSDDKILQLAKELCIEVDLSKAGKELVLAGSSKPSLCVHCASPWCLSCTLYRIHKDLVLWPAFLRIGYAGEARFCEICGEPLKDRCWKCSAPAASGAFCPNCSAARVRFDQEMGKEIIGKRGAILATLGEVQAAVEKIESWHNQRHSFIV